MEFPNDEKGDVLRRMYNGGDNLSAPRIINFSVVFDAESNARAFCELIAKEHDVKTEVNLFNDEENSIWDVTVDILMIPTYNGILAFEKELEKMAAPLNGFNDGWGCIRQLS